MALFHRYKVDRCRHTGVPDPQMFKVKTFFRIPDYCLSLGCQCLKARHDATVALPISSRLGDIQSCRIESFSSREGCSGIPDNDVVGSWILSCNGSKMDP